MEQIVISNPVPTPEEMAEIIGMSPERVVALRRIMDQPVKRQQSGRKRGTPIASGLTMRSSQRPAKAKRKR
jgi:hypothetical protein